MHLQVAFAGNGNGPMLALRHLVVDRPRSCVFQVGRQHRTGLEAHGEMVGTQSAVGVRADRWPSTASSSKDGHPVALRPDANTL